MIHAIKNQFKVGVYKKWCLRVGCIDKHIRNYANVIFHHRGHREHREKYKYQSSVNIVLSMV